MEKVKTLIIGSGPAGYTAAIYAAEPTSSLCSIRVCNQADSSLSPRR